jgi:DNA-binding MarR family transcriptional regulator
MRHKDIYKQPGYLIRRLHQFSTATFAAQIGDCDLTQIQLSILLVVADFPGIDATRISALIGTDRTTIGQALQLLEDKRLLRRERGAHDKRTKSLVITTAGETLARGVSQFVPGIGDLILKGLTRQERQVFIRLLRKLVADHEGSDAIGVDDNAGAKGNN